MLALTDDVVVAVSDVGEVPFTDDVIVVDNELNCPKVPVTVVVPAFADTWFVLPKLAETCVPVDTAVVVGDGGGCVGGADVWAGVGEYCNVGVGIVIGGNDGLGNILLIGCGVI